MRKLLNKVAVVTGASRGIGRAISELFVNEGASLALCARNRDDVGELGRSLVTNFGAVKGALLLVRCDVTDECQVSAFISKARSKFGSIDILVNNVGDATSAPLLQMDLEFWEKIVSVNLTSVFLMARAVLPLMIAQKSGRIINVASISGKYGGKYISAYSAAKHGVLGFTKSVALEVADKGISICAVCPGYVNTPATGRNVQKIMDRTGMTREEVIRFMRKRNRSGKIIEPSEVAAKVLKLASGKDVNGRIVDIW